MSARPDPMAHLCEVAAPLVDSRCFPAVQFGAAKDDFPAIIYYALSPETVTTLTGPFETALALRYECRAKDYDEAVELSKRVLSALRAGGRLTRIGAGVDDYDEALELYRRTQSVTLLR